MTTVAQIETPEAMAASAYAGVRCGVGRASHERCGEDGRYRHPRAFVGAPTFGRVRMWLRASGVLRPVRGKRGAAVTPVLHPDEPVRFCLFDGDHARYLLPIEAKSTPMFARFGGRATYEPARVVMCDVRTYRSIELRQEWRVGYVEGQEPRLLAALYLAEIAIMFCMMLRAMKYQIDAASHVPPDLNGFRISIGGDPVGYPR